MGSLPLPDLQRGVLWDVGVPLRGDWLGGLVPNLDRSILLVLLSVVPVAPELRKLWVPR